MERVKDLSDLYGKLEEEAQSIRKELRTIDLEENISYQDFQRMHKLLGALEETEKIRKMIEEALE